MSDDTTSNSSSGSDTRAAGSDASSDGETTSGPRKQTDDGLQHYEIQGKLQAAHRATLHMPDGTDIELDLEEKHQDGTAEYKVWGIEDTSEHDGPGRHYRTRLRLFCDARIIGASDDSDDPFSTTVAVNLDTSEAEDQLSDLRAEIEDLQREIQRLSKRLNGLVHGPERSRVGGQS